LDELGLALGHQAHADRLTYIHISNMVFRMKTTLNIDDSVMQRLREAAARQGRTMSELVEAGLRRVLEESEEGGDQVREPLPQWQSGGAYVDVADRDALLERMERD
jgi:plasmid stability protein